MTRSAVPLRERRLKKAWTQEHLADAAGVGLRTVQRLESGHPARAETLLAIAAALDVEAGSLVAAAPSTRAGLLRTTPLLVMETIDDAVAEARAMGFDIVETGDPGCVGLGAGRSHKILATRTHIAAVHGEAIATALVGRVVDYLHVVDLDAFVARRGGLDGAPVVTGHGTREVVLTTRTGAMIVAELLRETQESR